MKPIMTFFDPKAMPENLLMVAEWLRFARKTYGLRSWESAARRYAEQTGGALVLLYDDTLITFTKKDDGKISRKTFKPNTWRFKTTERKV